MLASLMSLSRATCLRLLWGALFASQIISAPLSTQESSSGITWGKCLPSISRSRRTDCGNMSVPINWDEPEGAKFNLGMIRVLRPANTTTERLGYLFVNPGGPGASTTGPIVETAGTPQLSSQFLESFDFIGVDPRGVGMSNPVRCNASIYNERASLFPKTKEEYDDMVDKYKRLGESCLKQTGDLVNYMDTISAAKDHEAVRKALGEEKINWLGLSYGTQLGAQYAQLFPNSIRTMVLDSMLQHSLSEASNLLIETTAYANELERFFEWANTSDQSVLKGRDVKQLWQDLINNATRRPLPVLDCTYCQKDLSADEIRLNAQSFISSRSRQARSSLATYLKDASEGSPKGLSTKLISLDQDRHKVFQLSSIYASLAVGCQDWSTSVSSFDEFQAKLRMAEVYAPLTRGASHTWYLQSACIGWPTPLNNPPTRLNVQTEDPIMIVSATGDPSTSYVWAVGMLEEIKNHFLLTRNGDGHISWSIKGDTTGAMEHFLLTRELPAPGTVFVS
jgi:pimeloyl-ACP methyl ester carboxylesterase